MLFPLLALQLKAEISPLLRGDAALQRHDLAAAIAAFGEAAASPIILRRSIGERMLAVIDRRFRHDFSSAHAHLARALALPADSALTLDEAARLALAEGHFAMAFGFARRAIAAAHSPDEVRGTTLTLADAFIEPELLHRIDGVRLATADQPSVDSARVVIDALAALVRGAPGRPDESRRLLLAGLIAGDGAAAADAVVSSYRTGFDAPPANGTPFSRALAALDPLLRAVHSPVRGGDARLAALLVRARLFDAAALVAPAGSETIAYARFCRRVERESDEYYRLTLLGEARFDRLVRAFNRASADLWPRLAWSGAPPTFYPAAVAPELGRRFGTVIQFGVTGGFFDLHMGHTVRGEQRVITQYGRRVRVRSVILDGMVSNGLQSWAWGAAGAHGGWERSDSIIEVRPVFVDHAMAMWPGDSLALARERAIIAADSVTDFAIIATDSTGFLPGVAARLRRDARDGILDSLRGAGLTGTALRGAFVAVVARLLRESSILAHEGRHALDDVFAPGLAPEEREFRAKLSEVAFARHPRVVLSAIVHPNIGDATPHGRANLRIMRGLVRWIRVHASEIRGYDPSLAPLMQLPLLSDDQLRRAFRGMDPLASA